MFKKIKFKFLCLMLLVLSAPVIAFDLEDYATTYRSTRDAYVKSVNELKLATGPYQAAQEAYIAANIKYNASLGSPDDIRIAKERIQVKKNCLLEYQSIKEEYYAKFKD
jgi:hypothetical protein